MDIHKPKPVHGLREFFSEILIVVLGVLIAPSAENVVERFRWKDQADYARDALKREIEDDAVNAWERLIVSPCLRAKLQDLVPALQRGQDQWKGAPMQLIDAWRSVSSSGDFSHLKPVEVDRYKTTAYSPSQLNSLQEHERGLATMLAPLSFDRTLTSQQRHDLLAHVAEIDRDAWLTEADAKTFLEEVAKMRLRFDDARIQRRLREVLIDQQAYRGSCVHSLPLNLS